jgi:phospholipid/cholesterol/gamma-HCH transport system substrate-binding protein
MQGSRAFREGTLGLFALVGLLVFGAITIWIRGGGLGQRTYRFTVEFPDVEGLQVGAPVRYRGVTVGKIVGFRPDSNKVEAIIEISSTDLRIPSNVKIQTNRYGLIGEAAVDITPLSKLSESAALLDPLSPDCDPQKILCHNARLQGEAGAQLVSSFTDLAKTYNKPELVANLGDATKNTSLAAKRIAKLSDETALVIRNAQKDLSRLTLELLRTSQSVTKTANTASRFVDNLDSTVQDNRGQIARTFDRSAQLVANLNSLISDNRGQIVNTLDNINRASLGIGTLAANLNTTSLKLNASLAAIDTQKIMQNLETVVANAVETSNNLREITKTLNDPATIVTLQKTLESARVTFENTAKITSEVDEFLGDPAFRDNLRRLINGLGALVSSTEQLEYHLRLARTLDSVTQELASHNVLKVSPHLDPSQMRLDPTPIVRQPSAIEESRGTEERGK